MTPEYEQVWLTEVETPETFSSNVVLWVDDRPQNNAPLVRQIHTQIPALNILRIRSTHSAALWLEQFGWLFARISRQIKIVSDMERVEERGTDPIAGITLANLLRNSGFTTQVLIYCTNLEHARTNAQRANASQEQIELITAQPQRVREFCDLPE